MKKTLITICSYIFQNLPPNNYVIRDVMPIDPKSPLSSEKGHAAVDNLASIL